MSNSKVSIGNIKVKQQKAKKDFWMTKDFSATEIFTSGQVNNRIFFSFQNKHYMYLTITSECV